MKKKKDVFYRYGDWRGGGGGGGGGGVALLWGLVSRSLVTIYKKKKICFSGTGPTPTPPPPPPPLCRMALAQLRNAAYVIGIFNGYTQIHVVGFFFLLFFFLLLLSMCDSHICTKR